MTTAELPWLAARDAEIDVLDGLIDQVDEHGGAVVISGEPGIGKSALLQHARHRAAERGVCTLTTVGVESEAELSFAGIHQLLRPIIGLAEQLPLPQRGALDAAFGITRDVDPDPFLVALAVLQLLCDAAETQPVAIFADDAHWLDRSSLGVLSFIARRIEAERVALVVAVRDGYLLPILDAGLPRMPLARLDSGAAAELLHRNAPDLHPVARARVLAEAAGNPLALVELARAAPSSADGHDQLSSIPPLTVRLEQAFAARLTELSEDAWMMLLAAALDGRASLEEVTTAASTASGDRLGLSALDEAVDLRLVEIVGSEVRFRHPLIRSAVRQAASSTRVLTMFEVLAGVVADPERRLWHRAMAAVGCDEPLAEALEAHASIARGRGAVVAAATALERAAALTADPVRRGERLVRAAAVAYELGLIETACGLLEQVEGLELSPLELARCAWLQHMISGDVWVQPGAAGTFVTLSRQMLDGGDADAALRALVPVAHRCWWTRTRNRTRAYLVDAAEASGVADDDPHMLAVMALAHPELTGSRVLERVSRMRLRHVADPVAAMCLGIAAEKAGDFVMGKRLLGRAVQRLREQGRLGLLTQTLVHYAWAETYAGDWASAAAAGLEGARLARETQQPQYGHVGQLVAAIATASGGTEPNIEEMIAEPEQQLLAMNAGPMLAPAHLARGAHALGDGRHDDAFRQIWPVFDENDGAFHRFMRWPALLDLVEAACRSDHSDQAAEALAEFEDIARTAAPPIVCAGLVCARPLLADPARAEQLFLDAIRQGPTGYAFMRARTLFSFGCWLRRQRRGGDSRKPLRESIVLFDTVGATRWSSRARKELRAAGGAIGQRVPGARDRLTAQELQIAQLAAQGLSNREIGERLFLSHRTVGSHLYRIFPKLEISSRIELRDAVADIPFDADAQSLD